MANFSGYITDHQIMKNTEQNYITGDVVITEMGKLTVEDNQDVYINGNYSLSVNGPIVSNASYKRPVIFKPNPVTYPEPANNTWRGLMLSINPASGLDQSYLNHTRIESALYGLNPSTYNMTSEISIDHLTLYNCKYGVFAQDTGPWVLQIDGLKAAWCERIFQIRERPATDPEDPDYWDDMVAHPICRLIVNDIEGIGPYRLKQLNPEGKAQLELTRAKLELGGAIGESQLYGCAPAANHKHLLNNLYCKSDGYIEYLFTLYCNADIKNSWFYGMFLPPIYAVEHPEAIDKIGTINSQYNDFYHTLSYAIRKYTGHVNVLNSDNDYIFGPGGRAFETDTDTTIPNSTQYGYRGLDTRTNARSTPNLPYTFSSVVEPSEVGGTLTKNSAQISYSTGMYSPDLLRFGVASETYTKQIRIGDDFTGADGNKPSFNHTVILDTLTPDTTYYYQLGVTDPFNIITTWSTEYSFTTLEDPDGGGRGTIGTVGEIDVSIETISIAAAMTTQPIESNISYNEISTTVEIYDITVNVDLIEV